MLSHLSILTSLLRKLESFITAVTCLIYYLTMWDTHNAYINITSHSQLAFNTQIASHEDKVMNLIFLTVSDKRQKQLSVENKRFR